MANGAVEVYKGEEPITCAVGAGKTVVAGRVVKQMNTAGYTVETAGAGDVPLGVAMTDGDGDNVDARMVPVAVQGVWELTGGGVIDEGVMVITGAAGKVVTIGAGTFGQVVGRAMTACTGDNAKLEVLVTVA